MTPTVVLILAVAAAWALAWRRQHPAPNRGRHQHPGTRTPFARVTNPGAWHTARAQEVGKC